MSVQYIPCGVHLFRVLATRNTKIQLLDFLSSLAAEAWMSWALPIRYTPAGLWVQSQTQRCPWSLGGSGSKIKFCEWRGRGVSHSLSHQTGAVMTLGASFHLVSTRHDPLAQV